MKQQEEAKQAAVQPTITGEELEKLERPGESVLVDIPDTKVLNYAQDFLDGQLYYGFHVPKGMFFINSSREIFSPAGMSEMRF